MKPLLSYLTEAATPVIQHFMVDFEGDGKEEGVKEYFERNGKLDGDKVWIGRSKRDGKYITLDEFKALYEYAHEHDMPCPMIVDYKHKAGDFVFRRWVKNCNDIFEHVDVAADKGAPYQGLHNTNLKEDGKWFPSAEDMESVISYAFNKVNGLFETDPENILYVTGNEPTSNSKAEQLMDYYAGNQEELDELVKALPKNCGKMRKLPNAAAPTKEWIELGEYGSYKPNNTPKTDVESERYRISFKKVGGSQLMSGYEQEAHATLMAAANEMNDPDIKAKVNKLFEKPWLRNINSEKDTAAREDAKERNRDLTNIVRELFDNKEFKKLVMLEAASGRVKFGADSPSTADMVFVWSDEKPQLSKMYKIDEYIDHIFNKSQASISLKTASKTSTALRIVSA